MQDNQKLMDEIGLYKTELEKYKAMFLEGDGIIDSEEQEALDALLLIIDKLKADLENEFAIIIAKAKMPPIISAELKRIFENAIATDINKEKLYSLISSVNDFLSNEKFKDASDSMKENAVYLSLKEVVLGKKTFANIEVFFEKQLRVLENADNRDILSPKLKVIPFKNIQEYFNEKAKNIPGIGQFFVDGHQIEIKGFPILIKLSLQASGDLAFFPTKLQTKIETDNAMDGTILEFFKQTNAYQDGIMDLKTSLTAARASKTIDFGYCKGVIKFDLFKYASSVKKAIENKQATITPLAVTGQLKLDQECIDYLNKNVVDCFAVNNITEQVIISLQLSASIDLQKFMEEKLIERKLKEEQKKALKNAEAIAEDLADGKPSKKGKTAAKALKKNCKVLQELGEEAVEKGAKEVRDKVIKETGEAAGKILLKRVGRTVLIKLIPGLNVVSTLYDIYQIAPILWDMYKKSMQTDYVWIKVNATEHAAAHTQFNIQRIWLQKEYYEELLVLHKEGDTLNANFPYAMKIEVTLTNCTGPLILEKEEDSDLTSNNCFLMTKDLYSDQLAEEFIQWFNKAGFKLSEIQQK